MATRKKIMTAATATRLTNTRVPFVDSNGDLVDDADMTFATDTLTVTKVVASTSLKTAAIVNDTGLAAGVYTPALTNTTNISASTAYECQYMRVGSVVTVSGRVNIDVTTGGADAQLDMTIPVASDFAAAGQAGGVATTDGSQDLFTIYADVTNNRVTFYSKANGYTTNSSYYFTFTYSVV